MELIAADRLYDYVPHNRAVCVRERRELCYKALRYELIALIRAGYVKGAVRKGELDYVILTVPRSRAMALLSPLRIEPSSHITRLRSSRTAKHWKACLDRAKSGQSGTQRSVFVGVAA